MGTSVEGSWRPGAGLGEELGAFIEEVFVGVEDGLVVCGVPV
jgi:hypothetical protein